jgi:hypothetical protein
MQPVPCVQKRVLREVIGRIRVTGQFPQEIPYLRLMPAYQFAECR